MTLQDKLQELRRQFDPPLATMAPLIHKLIDVIEKCIEQRNNFDATKECDQELLELLTNKPTEE